MKVKIVTINLWKCDGQFDLRMPIAANQLEALKPQVVVCQECFQTVDQDVDVIKFLSERLEMNYSFVASRRKKRYFRHQWVDSHSGLGVLASFTIGKEHGFDLPSNAQDGGRMAQQVEIKLSGQKKMLVTNVHLSHLRHAAVLRTQQVERVIEELEGKNQAYQLVCGDFNAGVDSAELQYFTRRVGALDCYKLGNGPEPRISLLGEHGQQTGICVDHILVLPTREKCDSEHYPIFMDSAIVLNTPDRTTGLYPSDHFGVSTTIMAD
jgi:endonuclease/exonuclease/phosphatase family metal-dependent hydrolase